MSTRTTSTHRYGLPRLLGPAGLWQAVALAIAILAIAFGPFSVKIVFAYLLFAGLMVRFWDGGYIELHPKGIRMRSFIRIDVDYSEILRVESYKPRLGGLFGRIMKRLWALQPPGLIETPRPNVCLALRKHKWVLVPLPLPLLLRRRTIYLHLQPEDVDSLVSQLAKRLSSE